MEEKHDTSFERIETEDHDRVDATLITLSQSVIPEAKTGTCGRAQPSIIVRLNHVNFVHESVINL